MTRRRLLSVVGLGLCLWVGVGARRSERPWVKEMKQAPLRGIERVSVAVLAGENFQRVTGLRVEELESDLRQQLRDGGLEVRSDLSAADALLSVTFDGRSRYGNGNCACVIRVRLMDTVEIPRQPGEGFVGCTWDISNMLIVPVGEKRAGTLCAEAERLVDKFLIDHLVANPLRIPGRGTPRKKTPPLKDAGRSSIAPLGPCVSWG